MENDKLIEEFMGYPKPEIGQEWIYIEYGYNEPVKIVDIRGDHAHIDKKMNGQTAWWFPHFEAGRGYFKPKGWDIVPEYRSDWNAIMPVLFKIEREHGCIVEVTIALVIGCRICKIGKKNEKAINFYGDNNEGKDPINAPYTAALEFIKWHIANTPPL